jgi:hypothetical protein
MMTGQVFKTVAKFVMNLRSSDEAFPGSSHLFRCGGFVVVALEAQ